MLALPTSENWYGNSQLLASARFLFSNFVLTIKSYLANLKQKYRYLLHAIDSTT